MEDEEINYRTLRKIQQLEKNSPVLSEIIPHFYQQLSTYLNNLDSRLRNEKLPQKQNLLKDEIENIKKISINIYEQREKKVLLAAVSKARSGNPDLKNMVDEEKNLYDSILNIMNKSREKFLEKKTEEIVEEEPKETGDEKTEEKVENDENIKNTNPILKVNKNIPEFIGTDKKKYNLRADDVLSVPEDMSEILLKKGVAEKIN